MLKFYASNFIQNLARAITENHFGRVNNDLFREYNMHFYFFFSHRPLGLFLPYEYETIINKLLRLGYNVFFTSD